MRMTATCCLHASSRITQGGSYGLIVNNPITVSSQEAGFQVSGCGVATMSASVLSSNILDANGNKETRTGVINQCAKAVQLSAANGGKFDEHIAAAIAILNKDLLNCYRITIKRINQYADPPVLVLPTPTKQTFDNVEVIIYRPYNFNANDIIQSMKTINANKMAAVLDLAASLMTQTMLLSSAHASTHCNWP